MEKISPRVGYIFLKPQINATQITEKSFFGSTLKSLFAK